MIGYRLGGRKKYVRTLPLWYHSRRYDKNICIPMGYESDGATYAVDLEDSKSWWIHDWMTDHPANAWHDGSSCSNWVASRVLGDVLKSEGYRLRQRFWAIGTFLYRRWIKGAR